MEKKSDNFDKKGFSFNYLSKKKRLTHSKDRAIFVHLGVSLFCTHLIIMYRTIVVNCVLITVIVCKQLICL